MVLIGGVLVGGSILWRRLRPALQKAVAEQSRTSQTNLREIGLAFHNYHDGQRMFPPAATIDAEGRELHGWGTLLLPHLEQQAVYDRINLQVPWDDASNQEALKTTVAVYLSPRISERRDPQGYALSHFAANALVIRAKRSLALGGIPDGMSNTMLAGEAAGGFDPWGSPKNVRDPAQGMNLGPGSFGGPDGRTCLILLGDGSVRQIPSGINPAVFKALGTPDGRERIDWSGIPL